MHTQSDKLINTCTNTFVYIIHFFPNLNWFYFKRCVSFVARFIGRKWASLEISFSKILVSIIFFYYTLTVYSLYFETLDYKRKFMWVCVCVYVLYRIFWLIYRKYCHHFPNNNRKFPSDSEKRTSLTLTLPLTWASFIFEVVCHGVDAFKIALITLKQLAAHKRSTTCTLEMHLIDHFDWRAEHCTLSNHRQNRTFSLNECVCERGVCAVHARSLHTIAYILFDRCVWYIIFNTHTHILRNLSNTLIHTRKEIFYLFKLSVEIGLTKSPLIFIENSG